MGEQGTILDYARPSCRDWWGTISRAAVWLFAVAGVAAYCWLVYSQRDDFTRWFQTEPVPVKGDW